MFEIDNTKYTIKGLKKFKDQLKKAIKQGKDINKLVEVLKVLANGGKLDLKYKDHLLNNTKYLKNCRECHIEPDWLLIYKYNKDELILFLIEVGSHSELFSKS